jgi:hypothetical protein
MFSRGRWRLGRGGCSEPNGSSMGPSRDGGCYGGNSWYIGCYSQILWAYSVGTARTKVRRDGK